MVLGGVALVVIGVGVVLLSWSAAARSFLAGKLAAQAGVRVARDQVAALEARMGHLARGQGGGVIVAGLVVLGWSAFGGVGGADSDPYLVVSLLLVFGAAGSALAEILRPRQGVGGASTARATTPSVADYVPTAGRVLAWGITGLGLIVLVATLLLTRSRWFDAQTIMNSPVPLLTVAVPVLALLTMEAVRRVLDSPQPARDESELYWQDVIRGRLLTTLIAPVALVSLFAVLVSGTLLDAAATAAVAGTGEVGPTWSLWLLIAGYLVPVPVIVIALAVAATERGREVRHIRERLWGGSPVGTTTARGT